MRAIPALRDCLCAKLTRILCSWIWRCVQLPHHFGLSQMICLNNHNRAKDDNAPQNGRCLVSQLPRRFTGNGGTGILPVIPDRQAIPLDAGLSHQCSDLECSFFVFNQIIHHPT